MGILSNSLCCCVLALALVASTGAQAVTEGYRIRANGEVFFRTMSGYEIEAFSNLRSGTAAATIETHTPLAKAAGKIFTEVKLTTAGATIGKMAKAGVRAATGPVGLLLLGMEAADWLFDADGTVTGTQRAHYKPGREITDGWCTNYKGVGEDTCAPTCDEAAQRTGEAYAADTFTLEPGGGGLSIVSLDIINARCVVESGTTKARWINRLNYGNGNSGDVSSVARVWQKTYEEPTKIASEDDYRDALWRNNLEYQKIGEELARAGTPRGVGLDYDPETQPYLDNWQQAKDALQDLDTQRYDAETTADTNHDGYLSPEEIQAADDFRPQDPKLAPEENTEVNVDVNVDIPTGCALLPQLCEIKDWLFAEPPEPEIPPDPEWDVRTIGPGQWDVKQDPLPGAQCPTDTFEVFGETYSVPWSPMCDFATSIKPLILSAAWFFGIFIVIRSGK